MKTPPLNQLPFYKALTFTLPYLLVSISIGAFLYITGLYRYLGTVDGYGWRNETLLNIWFSTLGISVPKWQYGIIFPLFYFIISVPFQEYIFRILPLKFTKNKIVYFVILPLIFTFLHAYYMKPVALFLVWGLAVLTSIDYWKHGSFVSICCTHSILAMIAFTLSLA